MNFKKIVFILFLFLLILFVAVSVTKVFQNDTFFYIPIGEYALKNGIDGFDHWSIHDNLVFKFAGWFAGIIFYNIYSFGGFEAIYGMVIGISIAITLSLFVLYYIENKSKFLSLFAVFLFVYTSCNLFTARSQIFSFLVFILELIALNRFFEKGKKWYAIVLILLAFALVLVHDTLFPFYFIFYLPYLAEILLNKIKILTNDSKLIIKKYQKPWTMIFVVFIILFICFIIGFATPVAGSAYTNMFLAIKGSSSNLIEELQPIHPFKYLPLLAEMMLVLGLMIFTKTKIRLKDFLFVSGFAIFALLAERNAFYFSIIGMVYLVNILNTVADDYLGEQGLERFFDKIIDNKIILVCILILFICLIIKTYCNRINEEYVDDLAYPVEATEWIKDNLDYKNARIWTHFNFGGWLELQGVKVFIDSRSGMYTEQENPGVTVLDDWSNTVKMKTYYKDIFDKYKISHVLLYNSEPISNYICYDEDYELIYQDDVFSLYEKVQED